MITAITAITAAPGRPWLPPRSRERRNLSVSEGTSELPWWPLLIAALDHLRGAVARARTPVADTRRKFINHQLGSALVYQAP